MKKNLIKSLVTLICIFCIANKIFSQPATLQKVIIIRHGEKPETGNNLSCQGFNRSIELANVLYSKFKLPDHIYVSGIKNGKATTQARMYQTIIPFAVKYNLNIDTRFDVEDVTGVADAIKKKTGTVLLVWEHNQIANIVHALGITDEGLKWKSDDFDSIWIITFQNGKAVLSKDRENLNPSVTCR